MCFFNCVFNPHPKIFYHRNEPDDLISNIKYTKYYTKFSEIYKGYYTISIGYRKIGGNFCKEGVNFNPIKIACLYNKFLYAIIFYILIIFRVFGGIC